MSDAFILESIRMLEEELASAKKYLAVYRRQHGISSEEKNTNPIPPKQPSSFLEGMIDSNLDSKYGHVKAEILAAIERCPMEYTVQDIEAILTNDGKSPNKTVVSQWMTRLTKTGAVNRIREGAGRSPALYSKTKPYAASLSKTQ